jgi:carboxylesterase
MSALIIPTAEPFFFPGDQVGCLLIHGFTGAPKEMLWMGEYLAAQGHSVLGIRLAGHATQPADMLRMRWRDWVASVEDGYHLLRRSTEHIFAIGLSMGGVLALHHGANHPVRGIIAMSTPYSLGTDPRLKFAEYLRFIQPNVPKGPADWHNPEAAKDHVDYPTYPTRAIAELRDLVVEMRAALPKIQAPVLLIHSHKDGGVSPSNAEQIFSHLRVEDKTLLWVENSGHVITREPDRQQVFEAAESFIQRVIRTQA